jgi:mannose-6-phosphate isomerase-like protein (cupin superfamily)
MNTIDKYINSGALELYVLGMLTEEEACDITLLAKQHIEIQNEIDAITTALQLHTLNIATEPSPTIKPFVMGIIDYTERLKNGEQPTYPPLLHAESTINDYAQWLQRPDMIMPEDMDAIHAKIIGFTPEATTIITWLRYGAPLEIHDNEYERFLIVEGTCDISIGDTIHSLKAGDYLPIPLYIGHSVKVTSNTPCKVILQRVAA